VDGDLEADPDHPQAFMRCEGSVDEVRREKIIEARSHVFDQVERICGDNHRHCPVKFLYGMLQYISALPAGQPVPHWSKQLNIVRVYDPDFVRSEVTEKRVEKRDTQACSPPVAFPNSTEPNCPESTMTAEAGSGV
jgi:hypothetical protein